MVAREPGQRSKGEDEAARREVGAGKTTTLEMIEGYRERDGGTIAVLGVDPQHATLAWRAWIGLVL